ncbi:MAG: hormogonium polysaccharide biosynthesis glycosyltransferase HpsE [Cyanobacteria bacterium P01_D01_bin.156]
MTFDFTLAIPTYNGACRLPELLDSLLGQCLPEDFRWQVIVVDNNSTDQTAALVREYQARWQGRDGLVYVLEQEQGAAFARQKAMDVAQSELVGFLDDDVIPARDWVMSAYRFGLENPNIGAYGGKISGRFEVPPPEEFVRIQSFLALRNRGSCPHRYNPKFLSMPPSAALVVRRKPWLENVPPKPSLGGRTRHSMMQGDDYEPLIYIYKAGWEIWYNPEMHVEHKIPASRLEKNYLLALSRGCGICVCHLRMMAAQGRWEQTTTFTRVTAGNLKRLVSHLLEYRIGILDNLITQCEFEFFLSSFLSSFAYLRYRLIVKR